MQNKATSLKLKNLKIRILYSILFIVLLLACKNNAGNKNRLAKASSPYLQEHADNPVNWYEWGDEAMITAKKENKPLLVSIGYASCHWCHVMEKESFMDTGVARIMNEKFICIKVDREERPDIDNVYMDALQLLSGSGGWPLNAFALPDGKPFFAGTYYSKSSWKNLLNEVANAYAQKNSLVIKQAEALTKGIADLSISFETGGNTEASITKTSYQNLYDSIYQKIDPVNGGLKGAPKFPMPAVSEFLLQHYYLTRDKQSLEAALLTLNKMALGGIYDHIGGGFARYSTDTVWRVPHFEKMLYDNGLLIGLYAHAYQITQNDFYKDILEETITFVERDLSSAEGGFYSSLNADTEEGEGKFYTWKENDFKKIVEGDKLLTEYFNISSAGNWENGNNILSAGYTPREFAILKNQSPGQFISSLSMMKNKLLTERNKRNKPSVDTKVLTAWNAIMMKGYVDAYFATGTEKYLANATTIGKFIEKYMSGKDGGLMRNYKDGRSSISGFLDDYAWTALAFMKLYQANFDIHWLKLARQLSDHAIEKFYNKEAGLFYYASKESSLVVKKIEVSDNAIPSSNAVMANVLYSLGVIFDNKNYADITKGMMAAISAKLNVFPVYHAQWCSLAGLFSYGTNEVVVMGRDAVAKSKELQKKFLPASVIMGETDEENLPLMEGMLPDNKTLIYVCVNRICKKPVEEVTEALKQLN